MPDASVRVPEPRIEWPIVPENLGGEGAVPRLEVYAAETFVFRQL